MSVERERTVKEREIYYLPGMGGRLNAGLGKELFQRGFALTGRETVGTFKKLRFGQQIDAVKQDLVEQFWSPGSRVIANSFGGYLFLHAQLGLAPFPGRVLLLSPIIGSSVQGKTGMRFYPPRADVLKKIAQTGTFPKLCNIEVHVGEKDWQAGPEALLEFCNDAEIDVQVVPGLGHVLGSNYVGAVLDRWLDP